MSAGEWALVAVLVWMGGTMAIGALVAWIVLRRILPPASPVKPPLDPGEFIGARAAVPLSQRAGSLRGSWTPPPGA